MMGFAEPGLRCHVRGKPRERGWQQPPSRGFPRRGVGPRLTAKGLGMKISPAPLKRAKIREVPHGFAGVCFT